MTIPNLILGLKLSGFIRDVFSSISANKAIKKKTEHIKFSIRERLFF